MEILVLRHVPHEHLGTLSNSLQESGISYRYVNFYEDVSPNISLDNLNGLIVLGGPMNVYETDLYSFLELEEGIIKQAIEKKIPVLGICLGAQLIAKSLGAKVTKNSEKEIGWYPLRTTSEGSGDKLFKHFNSQETVFQWHGDTFEIPKGAVHLASSPLCANQAFLHGSNVYALQFHIEVTSEMISVWLNVSENKSEISCLQGKINPEVIEKETPKLIGTLNSLAANVFREFAELIKK